MKLKTIYRCPYSAVGSLMFAALIGLGATRYNGVREPQAESAIITAFNNILNGNTNEIGISAKTFFAAVVDNNNNKWFLTELGIISFTGEKWTLHIENTKVAVKYLKDIAYEVNPEGTVFWIASANGVTSVSVPFEAGTNATAYNTDNAAILSNNVVKVAIGKGPLRWFGTDKGISALNNNKWLTTSYEEIYPEMIFQEYPITSMATNHNGDSLYVGTDGAGVARVFRNDVDAISGASVYAQWGPIILPSDKIYSIFITSDGAKWFGTDLGIAKHTGNNTLENWTVFTTDDGLVNNFVQAITADERGNLWFGTKGGISVFDGSKWTSYTKDNGLNSNNILCITIDRNGIVWIGTDDGVTCYNNGVFINYR